ncbi:MAG: PfkB family carbohydrate kinase [Oscillospiraceae bacterium]|nr:PfkB family carbohydrate kinase [Oscillospiraceae bacterium]
MQSSLDARDIAQTLSANGASFTALIGFDGFVDELMHVVDKRHSAHSFTKVNTLADLGGRISRAAGLSTNIELAGLTQKLGGNGPIFANALAEQGMDVTCIGALGKIEIHPVFTGMKERCKLVSVADPGLSFNLEFDDGKLIMGKHESLGEVTWSALIEKLGLDTLAQMLNPQSLDLLGLTNWTMLPHMSGIFEGMIVDVFPLVPAGDCIAFFDLADPEKRTDQDLARVTAFIRDFSARYRVVLGVNLKEALQVARVLGVETAGANLEEIAVKTGRALGVYSFVIHTVTDAGAYCAGQYYYAPGYFTPRPVLTTGAGDNFNAGFCLGLLSGLSVNEALLVGNASSGYYVRNARSATLPELVEFISQTKHTIV